jgi:hypothetical protein
VYCCNFKRKKCYHNRVRKPAIVIAIALSLVTAQQSTAQDTDVDRMVSEGEALAKSGEFSAAIDKWKAADKVQVRSKHACLIGLAYTRRELWPQAEIFFAQCRQRASVTDPVPTWLDAAEKQLQEKLANAQVALVKLNIDPPVAAATAIVRVSSFAPDESFSPRLLHLAVGQHTITVESPGYSATTLTIDVRNKADQFITVKLTKPGDALASDPTKIPVIEPKPVDDGKAVSVVKQPTKSSIVPWAVIGAGGAMTVGGVVFHLLWKSSRDAMIQDSKDNNITAFESDGKAFDTRRGATIALYSAGAVTIAAGVILKYTLFKHREESPVQVGATAGNGGGMLTIGWSQ